LGAVIVTLNTKLLGGQISFFQERCPDSEKQIHFPKFEQATKLSAVLAKTRAF
jgi:hypothetical protein